MSHHNLHSTMLLLYRTRRKRRNHANNIYIPLCFYFIFLGHLNAFSGSEFTFHYASTLSFIASPVSATAAYLHSTMLLLYPETVNIMGPQGPAFTFHYASTLSRPAQIVHHIQTDLHSTMLLLYQCVYLYRW